MTFVKPLTKRKLNMINKYLICYFIALIFLFHVLFDADPDLLKVVALWLAMSVAYISGLWSGLSEQEKEY